MRSMRSLSALRSGSSVSSSSKSLSDPKPRPIAGRVPSRDKSSSSSPSLSFSEEDHPSSPFLPGSSIRVSS